MNHVCPYYHDEDLIPEDLREILEERLTHTFTGHSSGTQEASHDTGGRARVSGHMHNPSRNAPTEDAQRLKALWELVDRVGDLAGGVRELVEENREMGLRLAHDTIHKIGHDFSHSNELTALEALKGLHTRLDAVPPARQFELIRARGLESPNTRRLAELLKQLSEPHPRESRNDGSTSEQLRLEAVKESLSTEIREDLKRYKYRVYRSLIRSKLPGLMSDLLEESRKLKDISRNMQHFFGISSAGWDLDNGVWQEVPWDIFEMSKQFLEDNPSVQRLADILGRGPGSRQGRQTHHKSVETLVEHRHREEEFLGKQEILGVEFGSDLNRLLPGEYGFLNEPDIEHRFYKELVDGELMVSQFRNREIRSRSNLSRETRQVEASEPLGPVVVALDTSGSMTGWPEQVAKALSLALVQICWGQKRRLFLILFSTEVREIDVSDIQAALPEFSALFSMEFRGGTDLRPALKSSIRKIRDDGYKNADLLIVSDFRVPKIMIKQHPAMESLRREGKNRIHALTIGQFPVEDQYNIFDSRWHYRISSKQMPLGITGLVEL
ncbi:VWA domain-containing protein [Salinispira pacifica]|uniref:VWFA domain-containing protein n=1 Tax=Salinispira pacifica TaxID=1307761 RepID=V5WDU2_9SPIO|nr:VWA domain-containing protein [Salinispira pacifica]AHC13734.1 hypothetical protein L21SP2_0294 [Salinispira pacifica]